MVRPSGNTIAAAARRHPFAAFAIALGAFLSLVFFDPLFLPRTFVGRDLVPFFLPIEKAVHSAWSSGHVPLLLPEISFGRPLAANPNTGVFYPLRVAMAAFPFPVAFKLFPVIHLWIAGAGAFLLARFLGSSSWGAVFAGLTYACSGPAFSEITYPDFLPGLALMPWVIWAAGRLARRPGARRAAILASIFGVLLLVGDVFTAFLSAAGAVLLTIQETPPRERAKGVSRLALSAVPALFLAAIQIVPALLFVPQTVRALGRFPLRVALMWSVSLWRLLELAVRFPFGNAARDRTVWGDLLWSGKSAPFFNTLYLGIAAGAALLAARPARGRRLLPYGLAAVALLLAVAGFYCPAAWLGRASPLPLRYPEKMMAGFALAAALLCAEAADSLVFRRSRAVAVAALTVAGAAAAAAGAVKLAPAFTERLALAHWTRYSGAAKIAAENLPGIFGRASLAWLAAAAIAAVSLHLRSRTAAALLLVAASAADLAANRVRFISTDAEKIVLSPPPMAAAVRRVNGGGRYGFLPIDDYFFGVPNDRDSLATDMAAAFGVFYAFNQDYDASDLYRVDVARRQIYRNDGRWPPLEGYLAGFSARSAVLAPGRMPNGFSVPGPVFPSKWIVVNPRALPTLRFARDVREVKGPEQAYEAIESGIDLSSETVVETGRSARSTLPGGELRLIESRPHRMEIESRSGGAARVVISRAYFPYRRFFVDGSPIDAQPANFCLSSVAVPAGEHRISVVEELPGGSSGVLLSLAGLLMIVFLGRKKDRDDEPAPA